MNNAMKVQHFSKTGLKELADAIDGWMSEQGEGLKVLGLSHSYAPTCCTALVLWRCKKIKKKKSRAV